MVALDQFPSVDICFDGIINLNNAIPFEQIWEKKTELNHKNCLVVIILWKHTYTHCMYTPEQFTVLWNGNLCKRVGWSSFVILLNSMKFRKNCWFSLFKTCGSNDWSLFTTGKFIYANFMQNHKYYTHTLKKIMQFFAFVGLYKSFKNIKKSNPQKTLNEVKCVMYI